MADTPDYKKGFGDGLKAVTLIGLIFFIGLAVGIVCTKYGGC